MWEEKNGNLILSDAALKLIVPANLENYKEAEENLWMQDLYHFNQLLLALNYWRNRHLQNWKEKIGMLRLLIRSFFYFVGMMM